MIRPIQPNMTTPSFKGYINLADQGVVLNTKHIKKIENPTSLFGVNEKTNVTRISMVNPGNVGVRNVYYVNTDYLTVAKAAAQADKTGDVVDIKA